MSGRTAPTRSVAVRDDRSSVVGRWVSSPAWSSARRGHFVGVAALGGVFGIAALSYWWTRAPLYNPSGTIDPWLYTALFVNFDQIDAHFGTTYYASRLPWIVPGRIVYGVLPVDPAYWVLHGLMYAGGVAAVFFLVRRHLGLAAGVIGAATLALSPLYWNAQYWDYIDGVSLTYLAAGLCFGLPLTTGSRRVVSLGAAGFFLAAAVTTNLFVALVATIFPIAYVFVQPATGLRQRVAMALKDVAACLVGSATLLVALGLHARTNGGSFLFFQPQVDVIRSGIIDDYKVPGYEWLRSEPRLLVPGFLVVVAAPLLALGRSLPPFRFAAGATAGLAFLTAFIYGWEFFAGGSVLEYNYYFSYFAISIALTMASIAALAVALVRSYWAAKVGAPVATTLAAIVSLGLIFYNEREEWTGRSGMRIAIALMVVAVLMMAGAVLVRRATVGAGGAVLATGAVALASHFAINSSTATFTASFTAPHNRDLYHAALDHVAFVKRSTAEGDPLPVFWYSPAKHPEFASIQSMYYFGYTYLDLELPKVTAGMRQRLDLSQPQTIVMLCETRDCAGGPAALRRAGYSYEQDSARLISRGQIRLWAVLLRRTPSE
jgi:hypothetical protein